LENSEGLERKGLCRRSERGHRFPEPIANTVRHELLREQWKHLRTTNVIESSFATVRHRTVRSKGCLSNKTPLAMIFKLAEAVERSCVVLPVTTSVPTRLDWASAATSPGPIH
jgi:hypothetical protein